ncbi:subtilisin inhibitor-like [Nymphaea colorata]|nr:subtilisin inhibitor-like [Nymphaea colorata]
MKQISLLLVFFLCFHTLMAQQDDTRNHYLQLHTQTRLSTMLGGIYERYFLEANTAPLRSWPELVGFPAAEAGHKIKSDMPMVRLQIVPQNHLLTRDFDRDRVRIYVDASGIVTKPPRIG